jgi:hypothetical protein
MLALLRSIARNTWSLIFILPLLCTMACKSTSEPAPLLNSVYGEFKIIDSLTVDKNAVDLSVSPLAIRASFSVLCPWKISIKGLRTGQLYTNEAFSDKVNLDWDGKANRPPSFGIEDVEIMLTVQNKPDTLRKVVSLLNPIPSQTGYVLATFVPGDEVGVGRGYSVTTDGSDLNVIGKVDNALGGNYFSLSGTDLNNWWIGGINIFPRNRYGEVAPVFPIPSISGASLFLNAYIYGYGPTSKTLMEIVIYEQDGINGITNESYTRQVRVDWTGWRLLSIAYSDFTISSTPGNSVRDSDKIKSVEIKALCNGGPSNTKIALNIANPVFTTLKPYAY